MAYFVLALGVLMSAAGLDAIATGYPIIQIERGWTTVIAGSAVMTGGLVVFVLGLVIRTLIDIKATLRARPFATNADATNVPAASRVSDGPPPAKEPGGDPSFAAGAAVAAAMPTAMPAEQTFEHREEPHATSGLDWESAEIEALLSDPEAGVGARRHANPVPEPVEAPLDACELQTPSTPDHDLAPPAKPPDATGSASTDDWLDRAFSAIDRDLAGVSGSTTTHPETTHPLEDGEIEDPHDVEPSLEEPAEAAAVHDEAAVPASSEESRAALVHSEPEQTPHELVVIGRYEAEGTSYVMYSDGSIEAQSEAGVYRFSSMAELKAFIED